jgi:hypothetical protein
MSSHGIAEPIYFFLKFATPSSKSMMIPPGSFVLSRMEAYFQGYDDRLLVCFCVEEPNP